ncbi:MAG: L-seryl-tRNA(Sec) selenium transferase [Dehalococcoidales bacterium]|jgi:L-seryl-tRNA(Ser) seleniumtransferase|nr:L-seryl-tRNA(Sec) selenium transferase [Dehalococcoidales bacterium]MDP6577188.1 L-seryl-tRNA(Sec) selenium transferase [Dehalococcoidales bacterium]MDP6824758.1 L-seryl-tRNA(Sec) selenium transferase [Dehalococcoidales bacterium]|tara:strand:- start:406 stop:1791 length:1386 start_codon:yes stop_codon:yes gene_type:complete
MFEMETEFRRLPGVDKILASERLTRLAEVYPHDLLVDLARKQLECERRSVAGGRAASAFDKIVAVIVNRVRALESPGLRPVVNATGVILHTNLGRAPLSGEAVAAMEAVARDYSSLEFDLDSGTRGSRQVHIESLLCQLTGAEAALVVNNNASAVLLGLIALARRKEVIVSRGQAVEIGGGFRIPDVMRQGGVKLVEVGTTNCTYINDFEQAISPRTAALLRVHSSNFRLMGFTNEVSLEDLVALAERSDLLVLDDLGSGCFLDTTQFGLAPEPLVQQSVAYGAGLICFSGDKLVGGPQAGIIVGKKQFIDRLKKHPLARAVRIDKIRLAGLAATLVHYLKDEATTKVPVWRMISAPMEEIARRAEQWALALEGKTKVIEGETMIGGGSLPGGTLPTRLLALGYQRGRHTAQALGRKLRSHEVPLIGRISEDVLLLDPRSVLPEEDEVVIQALRDLAAVVK